MIIIMIVKKKDYKNSFALMVHLGKLFLPSPSVPCKYCLSVAYGDLKGVQGHFWGPTKGSCVWGSSSRCLAQFKWRNVCLRRHVRFFSIWQMFSFLMLFLLVQNVLCVCLVGYLCLRVCFCHFSFFTTEYLVYLCLFTYFYL